MSLCAPEIDEQFRYADGYLEELRAQECPRITPTSSREDRGRLIDWLLLEREIGLIPSTVDKKPRMPCQQLAKDPANYEGDNHPSCKKFVNGFRSPTRDREMLLDVLDRHPEMIIGVVPLGAMVIVDIDCSDAISSFLAETGLDPEETPWISTERGAHIYVRCSDPEAFEKATLPKVDIMSIHGGYVIAPGCQRSDTGMYTHTRGTWGQAVTNGNVIRYITAPAEPPLSESIQQRPAKRRYGAVGVFLERTQKYWELSHGSRRGSIEGKAYRGRRSVYTGSRDDAEAAADLCIVWNVARAQGFSPNEAVSLAIKYRPKLAVESLELRRLKWLRKDAQRVYGNATSASGRPLLSYRADRALQTVEALEGRDSRRYRLLEVIIATCTTVQTKIVNIGQVKMGEMFDVDYRTIGRDLRALRAMVIEGITGENGDPVPVLSIEKRYWHDPNRPERCRTTAYSVGGMTALTAAGHEIVDQETAPIALAEKWLLEQVNAATGQSWGAKQLSYDIDLVKNVIDCRIFDDRLETSDPVLSLETTPNLDQIGSLVLRAMNTERAMAFKDKDARLDGDRNPDTQTTSEDLDMRTSPKTKTSGRPVEKLSRREKTPVASGRAGESSCAIAAEDARIERVAKSVRKELDREGLSANPSTVEWIKEACAKPDWSDEEIVDAVLVTRLEWRDIKENALNGCRYRPALLALRTVERDLEGALWDAEMASEGTRLSQMRYQTACDNAIAVAEKAVERFRK